MACDAALVLRSQLPAEFSTRSDRPQKRRPTGRFDHRYGTLGSIPADGTEPRAWSDRSTTGGALGLESEDRAVPSLLQLAVFRCLPLACSSSDAGGRIHDCEGVGKRKNVYRDHPSSLLLSRLHFEFQGLGASRDSVGDWHRRRASTGRYKEYSRDHRLLGRPNAPRFRPCIG